MKVYLAGALFSDQDRAKLEQVATFLEGLGIHVFLPHRDAGDLGSVQIPYGKGSIRDLLFDKDVREVKACDLMVALLDGADVDSGTALEIGIAYALRIPIFGLKSDFHRRNQVLNNMIWGACSKGKTICTTENELFKRIKKFTKKGNNGRGTKKLEFRRRD